MKKRIYILIIAIILLTGCTCEYDLKIENNIYKESVSIIASNDNEVNSMSRDWQIPTDKEDYNSGDETTDYTAIGNIYSYKLNNDRLIFSDNFNKSSIKNSTAASLCYNTLSVFDYNNNTTISSSNKVNCFDTYPDLTNVVVRITLDKKVITHNADSVNNKTYIWNLNRNNADNKSINLTFENSDKSSSPNATKPTTNNNTTKKDYTMYIFAGILLAVFLSAYFMIEKLKNKNDKMDD